MNDRWKKLSFSLLKSKLFAPILEVDTNTLRCISPLLNPETIEIVYQEILLLDKDRIHRWAITNVSFKCSETASVIMGFAGFGIYKVHPTTTPSFMSLFYQPHYPHCCG